MLSEIKLNGFASFKQETCLKTDKPVNFVYGLNGTGKSSITRYLADPLNPKFSHCSMVPAIDNAQEEILVYNQDYIHENFVEQNHQQGIFTLSKANKDAYDAIKKANEQLSKLQEQENSIKGEQKKSEGSLARAEATAREKVWELKGKYYGGDRVLDYCLEGVKGSKINLFNKVLDTTVDPEEVLRPIETLKQDLIQLTAMEGQTYSTIAELPLSTITETDILLGRKIIVGNHESTISSVIEEFANATWIRAGMSYVKGNGDNRCPFCHQGTITVEYIKALKSYFDESYEHDIQSLKRIEQTITEMLVRMTPEKAFEEIPILASLSEKYLLAFNLYKTALTDNLGKIRFKIEHPNVEQELNDCAEEISAINAIIIEANVKITDFNSRVAKLPEVKSSIKDEFWKYQRREYDSTLAAYNDAEKIHAKDTESNKKKIAEIEAQRKQQFNIIATKQKNVVNVEEAISHINNNLISIGIIDFHIVKCEGEDAYRIIRTEEDDNVFHTLSEGEKMLISFLYFVETCIGRKNADEQEKKKIIVIDDPISSLSHMHVFNISCLLREVFIDKHPFEQVFIFTHSLYFFYEIVYRKKEARDDSQKLFRITKNEKGSFIEEMKYAEIRNDYDSYWSVVNDPNAPKALIANCMRNIFDYFFGFVDRLEFNNIFNIQELKDVRFMAFNHYMNRESHNGAENINDFKEFNYDDFQEAFKLVFEKAGYGNHYKKMRKIGAMKA